MEYFTFCNVSSGTWNYKYPVIESVLHILIISGIVVHHFYIIFIS